MPPTPPTPPYSLTDVGTALVTVIMIGLDVVASYFGAPALDPVSKATLMSSLTILAIAGLTAYTYNRGVKNKTAASVAVAALSAPSSSPAPFTGGKFVITPAPAPPTPPT